jgi:hypothetical protein
MLGGTWLAAFMLPLKLAVFDLDIIPQPASTAVAAPATRAMRKRVPYLFIAISVSFKSAQHRQRPARGVSATSPTSRRQMASSDP